MRRCVPFAGLPMFCLFVGVTLAVGCGSEYAGPQRAAVKGRVTFDGEPVDGGSITFVPTAGDAKTARKASGRIVAGDYDIAEIHGPLPGPHRVEISWGKPTGKTITDGNESFPETKQVIPARFNDESELTADIAAGPNVHDFELKSN